MKYVKKFLQFVGKMFSRDFVHPVMDTDLSLAIADKLKSRRNEQEVEMNKYNEILNSYLRTYFSTTYIDNKEMAIAFDLTNKKSKQLCREVNSKNKLINIKKTAFEDRVKLTINKINENKSKKEEK